MQIPFARSSPLSRCECDLQATNAAWRVQSTETFCFLVSISENLKRCALRCGRRPTMNKAGAKANGVCSGHNAVTTGRDFEMCSGGESGRAVSYRKAQGRSIAFYDFFGNSF